MYHPQPGMYCSHAAFSDIVGMRLGFTMFGEGESCIFIACMLWILVVITFRVVF